MDSKALKTSQEAQSVEWRGKSTRADEILIKEIKLFMTQFLINPASSLSTRVLKFFSQWVAVV